MTPPPPAARKPRSPNRKAGIWDTLKTPEERSAYAKELASRRNPKNMARTCQRPGTPKGGWDHQSAAVAKTTARIEAETLVSKLQAEGTIAAEDTEGAKATAEALAIVRGPGGITQRRKWAKRLLRHYHPESMEVLS
ncbi:hypothetical protein FHS75_000936 [Novosphingobium marinum]|uniref:Uncharacterized protein n=1 Tax=Novosphingobium marinum TaxID=1514948 RepID=A0A7Y9XUB0_9SPHN|nr:hypothetical protein [Novosphingobium marinum]